MSKSGNKHRIDTSLIREYVDALLAEEGNDLYNTFIQPFVDVGITAGYGLEKLSAQVQTVVKGFLLGLPTLIVPFLEYDYEAFREEEKEKVDSIKKKYEKTLQANLDAITSNDAFGLAFLLAPASVLGAQLAVKAPEAALKVLDVLTGGSGVFKNIQQALSGPSGIGFHDPGGHASGAWASGGGGGYGDYGDGINEDKEPSIKNAFKDKKVLDAIQKSPVAQQMKRDAVGIIVGHIQRFLGLQDYDQMRKMAQGDVGFNQIGQKLAQMNQSGQVPVQNNQIITQAMVPQLKQAYKDFWIKQMQQLAKKYPEASTEIVNGIKQVENIK